MRAGTDTPNSEREVFEKPFMTILFALRFLPEICRKEVAEEIFGHISFSWGCFTWDLNQGLLSNKPTHYLLDPTKLMQDAMHSLMKILFLLKKKYRLPVILDNGAYSNGAYFLHEK